MRSCYLFFLILVCMLVVASVGYYTSPLSMSAVILTHEQTLVKYINKTAQGMQHCCKIAVFHIAHKPHI